MLLYNGIDAIIVTVIVIFMVIIPRVNRPLHCAENVSILKKIWLGDLNLATPSTKTCGGLSPMQDNANLQWKKKNQDK